MHRVTFLSKLGRKPADQSGMTVKSAFYFSDSPFGFIGTKPSYYMTVL